MKTAVMLRDVVRSLFRRPATRRYPWERRRPPERLRGALQFDPSACTGCRLCEKDCPAQAIEIITVDRAAKRYALRYHLDRCTFCAQCVHTCRFGSLTLSNDQWELAAPRKEPFTITLGDEADVEALRVLLARHEPAPPSAL